MTTHHDSVEKLGKVEEALTCIICQGIMEDPHALYCGHAFCGMCILQWFKTSKICPTCKEPVRRQPIQINSLQKLCEALRPEGAIPTTRLTRENWVSLFPIGHQAAYIRDEDQDGVIFRCSECGWELDEENYCTRCSAFYGEPESRRNRSPSSAGSHYGEEDEEEASSGFVVSDNDPMEYSDHHSLPDDDPVDEFINAARQYRTIEIDDSDDDGVPITRANQKRRREIISDDDSDGLIENDMEVYARNMHSDPEIEEEEEEEDDFPEDPFPRSMFIDDCADDDDEFEERPVKSQQPRHDPMAEMISKAKGKMASNLPSSSMGIQETISSSSSSSDGESDADYGGISVPLSSRSSRQVPVEILDEGSSSAPLPGHSAPNIVPDSGSKRKRASKKSKRRQKKRN